MASETRLSPFETQPIGKLLVKFAVPAVISLVVNSIYNLVDQIFIGQGVGYVGNASTNITFPIVTLCLLFSTLVGDGGVAFFSLRQGARDNDVARNTVGNMIFISLLFGLVFLLLFELFLHPIIRLFGGVPGTEVYDYAIRYARIMLIGTPCIALSISVSNIIRADGNPAYSMVVTLTGCIVNVILDYILIMVLHWGVTGAAVATIIGQILNAVLSLLYIPRFKSFTLKAKDLIPRVWLIRRFLPLGISSAIVQASNTLIIIVVNNILLRCGEASIYGADITLAAFGIVMKVNAILSSVMIGLGIGSQPIVGFNYGAKNYRRVRETYRMCIIVAVVIGCIGWCCFQFGTQGIVNLFGQESELYNEFALRAFRTFLSACMFLSVTFVTGIFLQALGKPILSMIDTISRPIFFSLPFMLIFSRLWGIDGVLVAGPVTDFCAFLVAALLGILQVRKLRQLEREAAAAAPEA